MTEDGEARERRRYERSRIDLPVIYKVGKNTLTGTTMNVCNEGILVESSLSSKVALNVIKILSKKPGYRLEVEYTCEGNTYLRDAEVRHFHLDFPGGEPYRLTVGFWIPKIE